MGLLTEGKPLSSEETLALSPYIREHGITQFLATWNRVKDIQDDELRFGDEIEVGILRLDHENKTVRISVRSAELQAQLEEKERRVAHQNEGVTWHPEFGAWMIESTPSRPYTNYVSDLLRVERNMVLRRRRMLSVLGENEIAPTVTSFPLLGVGDFIEDPQQFDAPFSHSEYLPDYIINPHPRFAALTQNIRERRGEKVDIRVPLYRDINTPEYQGRRDSSSGSRKKGAGGGGGGAEEELLAEEPYIHMDCMAFGMGMCCLQVTFQGRDVDESRYMYDQLAVLAPIMLAMTAATPIFKGRLADVDCRWDIIAQSVDDRTPAERGLVSSEDIAGARKSHMAGDGVQRQYKSRYGSVSSYIYHCKGDTLCHRTFEQYNDVPCPVDRETKQRLRDAGLDENLAHHVAHLFSRDPLVVFDGQVELDDAKSTDHFENIQSTNWQTCRWKPPPPRNHPDDPHIGWRTEFRSMEVQLTDFENAAFTVFVVLVTRVVLAFDLALYIPLSKVDENMDRSQRRDAVRTNKFFFRKFLAPPGDITSPLPTERSCTPCALAAAAAIAAGGTDSLNSSEHDTERMSNADSARSSGRHRRTRSDASLSRLPVEDAYEEMSMNEIFNGKDSYYPGLIPLVYAYLDYIDCDTETFKRLDQYLVFISKRAKGELITPATWMRQFVERHPAYKKDSVISGEVAYDLMSACQGIGEGTIECPEILGDVKIDRVRHEDAYGRVLAGRLNAEERSELLQKLIIRARKHRDHDIPRGTQSLEDI